MNDTLLYILGIVIVVLGAVALATLPVSQYPNIVPPTVQVTASYPGASAQTVVDNVALPIELQVNGVEGMIYMQSTSTDAGTYTLTVTFAIGTDLDFAQVLVQNKVSAAMASLPLSVQAQGVIVEAKLDPVVDPTYPNIRAALFYILLACILDLLDGRVARMGGFSSDRTIREYATEIWDLTPTPVQIPAYAG